MKKIAITILAAFTLTGCAEAEHRYGPHPFGDDSVYDIKYISTSGQKVYWCLYHNFEKQGLNVETVTIEDYDTNNFFVSQRNIERGRIDIDTRQSSPQAWTGVTAYAPSANELRPFSAALKTCKQELEPESMGEILIDSILHHK